MAVRKVLFQEHPKQPAEEGEKRPPRVGVNLEFQVGVQSGKATDHEHRAVVTLVVKVHLDPKWQPYELEVVIAGAFAGIGLNEQQFDQFCRLSVPSILFPYVRQLVHNITTDANFGPVRIDPVNLVQLAAQSEWSTETTVPSEPSQPSAQ